MQECNSVLKGYCPYSCHDSQFLIIVNAQTMHIVHIVLSLSLSFWVIKCSLYSASPSEEEQVHGLALTFPSRINIEINNTFGTKFYSLTQNNNY